MTSLTSFRGLAAVIGICVAIAQTPPAAPSGAHDASPIPLAEAEAHFLQHEVPAYPPLAKAARIEGTVHLVLRVDSQGVVAGVVRSSGHPLLTRAAEGAALLYRYRPFEISGVPSEVLVEASVAFVIAGRAPHPHTPFPDVTDLAQVVMEYGDGSVNLRVTGGGIVEYEGLSGVAVGGKHQRRIARDEVQHLLQAFRDADFFSLSDDYSVGATDVGTTTTSIQVGAAKKSVTDDWVQVPAVLKAVQEVILKFSQSDQWMKGNADTVAGLLAETSDPRARRDLLSDALPGVATYGDAATVADILATGVDLDRPGAWHATALMHAAERGLPDMVAVLLKAGADRRARDKEGRSALFFGAGSGNVKVIELLLGAGAGANEDDKYRDTPLMGAAAAGNPDVVRVLLHHGARVNARNVRRQSALLSAATGDPGFAIGEMGRWRTEVPEGAIHRDVVVALLLDAGADINAHGWFGDTALFSLEEDVDRELLRHHIDIEARNEYGETALIETVSETVADLLIKAGANVNAQDKKSETALIKAAERNYVAKLRVLVKAPGIHLDHRDSHGATALMVAKKAHHEDCVQVLLAAGATL
jgi:TonB family protein